MANVPNTTTFTFQDVTTSVYNDTAAGRNLTASFTAATGSFDPSYVGSKTNLLNFRNYQATPPNYSITFYGATGYSADPAFFIDYNTDGTSNYMEWGTNNNTYCTNVGTLTGIPSGTTVYFALVAYGAGGSVPYGTYIQFRATNSTSCPTSGTLYCQDPSGGIATAYSVVVTSNMTISFQPTLSGGNWSNWVVC
jgi:hypothetical protein